MKHFKITFGFLLLSILITPIYAQQYSKLKISLDNGQIIEGQKGSLSDESVSCIVSGQSQSFRLDEVTTIASKKGNAMKWASGMGGCCLGIFGAAFLSDPGGLTVSVPQFLLSTVLMTAASAGIGYLVGNLLDPWQNIYTSNSVALKKLKPILNLDQKGRPLIGFSYSF